MKSKSTLNKLIHDNNGSAVVTVIISMLFIIALGVALLFASYTGVRVKVTERADRDNFYTAETVMATIRTNLQTAVSDALAAAYTEVLPKFNSVGNHQDELNTYFGTALFNSRLSGSSLFSASGSKYNVPTLQALFPPSSADLKITISNGVDGASTGNVSRNMNTDGSRLLSLSLKSISVKVIKDGYESNITSDICINMPEFFVSPVASVSVENYSIVANRGLKSNSNDAAINGTVYVGKDGAGKGGIEVSGGKLSLSGGDVYCSGPVSIINGGTLTLNAPDKEFWAQSLTVGEDGNKATANLTGSMFVSDDLIINGTASAVTLNGKYFGFGSSETDSSKSSALIVNGRDTKLSLNALERLSLAGVSFIDVVNTSPSNASIPMGESTTVKSNQLAYLVPPDCISNYPSNPYASNSTAVIAPVISRTEPLWKLGTAEKTLNDYLGADDSKGSIKTLYKKLGGNSDPTVTYVFISFKKPEYANVYFRDYFTAFPDRINDYLNLYVSLNDLLPAKSVSSAGNTFSLNNTGDLVINPATGAIVSGIAQKRFDDITPPFASVVNTANLLKLPNNNTHVFSLNGRDLALVSKGDVTYGASSSSDIQLIIAGGNVRIDRDFKGIILSGGTVTVNKKIDSALLADGTFNATATIGGAERTLSEFLIGATLTETTQISDPWSSDKLVIYENWSKH